MQNKLAFELLSTIFQVGIGNMIENNASFKSQLLVADMFDALWADVTRYAPASFEVRLLTDDNIDEYTHSIKFAMGLDVEEQYLITIHDSFISYEVYKYVDLPGTGRLIPIKKSKIE